jgi:WD40 repeat protein/DNA-binding SARP family transcriptional activator
MATLSVKLLGPFQVLKGDEPITKFESDRVRALLAYLAVETDRPHRRERLASLLWPDWPERSARTNLRRALSNLRQVIGDHDAKPPYLQITRQTIQFNSTSDTEIDARVVASVASINNKQEGETRKLEKAIGLYKGDFLEGFTVADSPSFEEWALLTREQLNRIMRDGLQHLAEYYSDKDEYQTAIGHYRRLLEMDPLQEGAHRGLMKLLVASGQRSAALAQYEACRRILEEELGVEPSSETKAVFDRINSGDMDQTEQDREQGNIRGYELRERIGVGRFGEVYRAYQKQMGRDVVIKIIPPQYANQPEFIRRFEIDARRVALLEHPHIVPLYDYWREPDGAYLVMRWMKEGSLQTSLQQGAWTPEAICGMIDQIAGALSVAHQQGIIHGDIQPSNILLDKEGNAYLVDFGITPELISPLPSRQADLPDEAGLYLAPEQVNGGLISAKTDLYGLGLVLLAMFVGESRLGDLESRKIHKNGSLPSISEIRDDVPDAVDLVIQRATTENPADRYETVLDLSDELRKALCLEGIDPRESATRDLTNPYKGLRPFHEVDAEVFFGRDALVEQLVGRLKEKNGEDRFLALVGPSGSGKSSVIRAGLIPFLRKGAIPGSENWYVIQMLPGDHPLEELETALLRIAVNPPDQLVHQMREDERGLARAVKRSLPDDDSELLLFIDQFEEVFTLVEDEAERAHFLRSITAAVGDLRSRVRVILTLRADFYDRPLLYPEFGELLHTHMETVMPLSPSELELAISGPADSVGVKLEPGLISEIVSDVADEPGALPLLQYALTELFENRENSTLTSQAYQVIGGVAGALGRSAEREFVELDDLGKGATKQLFLRLVTVGESTEENRRRVLQAEIASISDKVQTVTAAYGRARLLSFDRDPVTRGPTVELAHEALLQEWPRLRGWLDENRADLRLQSILAAAAREWAESAHEASFHLRGSRLDQFEGWANNTAISLTLDEAEFLEASLGSRKEREAVEEARRERELEAARQLVETERNRAEEQTRSSSRLRRLAGALGLTLLVALILSFFAFQQSRLAEEENRLAASRELAAASVSNLDADPELSILLAMQAISSTYDVDGSVTVEAESALHQAIQTSRVRNSLSGSGNFAFSGAQEFDFSGEALLVPEEDGKIVFYSAGGYFRLFSISGHRGEVIGFNRSGQLIAIGNPNGEVGVWKASINTDDPLDLSDPREELYVFSGHTGGITYVTFNNDGTLLATASSDETAKVWDLESGEELVTLVGHEGTVEAVAFHPLGTYIATASTDRTAKIWELASEKVVHTLSGHSEEVIDVAFNPDGNRVATTSRDGTAKLWDTTTGEELIAFLGHSGSVNAVAFSPSGELLVTGGKDATVRVWEIASGQEQLVLSGHSAPIYNIIFSPSTGTPLETSSLDGTAKAWDIRPEGNREWLTLVGHREVVFDVAYNSDGTRIASASWDGSAIIWSGATGSKLLELDTHKAEVTAVSFSPDGGRLVSSSFDGTLKMWDANDGGELLSIDAHANRIHDVAFDKTGKRVASAGGDGQIRIWDADSGEELVSWRGGARLINRLVFSPSGERIATAGGDGTAKVWDATTGELLLTLSGHSAEVLNLSYSPDGARLATAGGDGLAKVWDAESGEELFTLSGHGTSVWAAAFSPDGSRIATMSLDKTAKLWDAETGEELLNLINYNDGRDLAFTPDGDHLAVASGDGSVRVYVLPIEELMALARLRLTRSLTDEECQRYLHILECPISN